MKTILTSLPSSIPDPSDPASSTSPSHSGRSPEENGELRRFEVGPFRFHDRDFYYRHLMFDSVVDPAHALARERFEALARSVRDVLMQRWVLTKQTRAERKAKEVCYISMEFLIGRALTNNILNMGLKNFVQKDLQTDGQDWQALAEQEPDSGLGNGGLGRLAACFIDSMATLEYPAIAYGLRYEYGSFRQGIENGWQTEQPDNWLRHADPWEVARPHQCASVQFDTSFVLQRGGIVPVPGSAMRIIGIPFDRPVVGFGGKTVNTLRLWGAAAPNSFDLGMFSDGDFVGAINNRVMAEALTRVLYPNDSRPHGRTLRFMQESFLVCCSLDDIIRRFLKRGNRWADLPDKVAIQLNDTHPSLAVAELMRILLDRAGLSWEQAWDITVRTLAYTNHTLLPEALEKWPVELFEMLLPRHLQIIYEINARFLAEVRGRHGDDEARLARMSLIEEHPVRSVRMAHLAIVGSHSTNGVSELHSDLIRTRLVPDFAIYFPERFNSKTNGVTPRRWLMHANPALSALITNGIGNGWITDLERLGGLKPLAEDAAFREAFLDTRRNAKVVFAQWLVQAHGVLVDPESIYDCQIKRIHEYKRQLLNVLHIIILYQRLLANPGLETPSRTFFFAGKAAPSYHLAKLVIKLIHCVAARIAAEPRVRDRIKIVFLPDYNVTLAERLIPATDVSEQISTAGFEASGTSNMKFMMNGALTVGTRDGATIEIARQTGEENVFLFGLTAAEVTGSREWYKPMWHYWNELETRQALDLLFSRSQPLSPGEPDIFEPIRGRLLTQGDYYMHLADLTSYARTQERVADLYGDPHGWARKALLNIAASGHFSADRTIREYAREIWQLEPSPVPLLSGTSSAASW